MCQASQQVCHGVVLSINEESGKNVNRKRVTVVNSAVNRLGSCNRQLQLQVLTAARFDRSVYIRP